MATHSSILAWRILGTEEPGGLPSMGSHRVGHNWSDLAAAAAVSWLLPCETHIRLLTHKTIRKDIEFCQFFFCIFWNYHMIFIFHSTHVVRVSEWVKSHSRVRLFATQWTVAYQAPPSIGFSRQEYWSGLHGVATFKLLICGTRNHNSEFSKYNIPLTYIHAVILLTPNSFQLSFLFHL